MSFVSYAQNFEDVMLWRALKDVEHGFYIDVGAQDPEVHSVTKAFYDVGWRGMNIEPVAAWHALLEQARPEDTNLKLAVASASGNRTFYEIPDTGLSTFDRLTAERHAEKLGVEFRAVEVETATLNELIERRGIEVIHFLKVDVEGAEGEVLASLDFSRHRPWIIVVEVTLPMTQVETVSSWPSLLLEAGYSSLYFDGINRFFVDSGHAGLAAAFAYPPNCFDDFVSSALFRERQVSASALRRAKEAEAAEARASSLHDRVVALESLLEQQQAAIDSAQASALEMSQRLATAELSAAEQQQRAGTLEEQLAVTEGALAQARLELDAAREARKTDLQLLEAGAAEIRALRRSLSWRLTSPLRFAAKPLFSLVGNGTITRSAANLTNRAIKNAMRRPWLVSAIHRVVDFSPPVRAAITRRVVRAEKAPTQSDTGQAQVVGSSPTPIALAPGDRAVPATKGGEPLDERVLLALSPRARHFYRALVTTRTRQNGCNS
tara:strand:- start:60356 stop:61834 length:1479 start_codon:yes stop_codon:yes gene_type:complete